MDVHATGVEPIDDTLYRLLRLASLVQRPLAPALPRHPDLTLNEWRLIVIMAADPDRSVQDLSRATGMDKMNVSRAVRRLMAQNLLTRTRDLDDRRRICHALTSDGWRLYQRAVPAANRAVNSLTEVLTDDERAILTTILDRLENRTEHILRPGTDV